MLCTIILSSRVFVSGVLCAALYLKSCVCFRRSVRSAVSQVVASVAKQELASGNWPELFQFLQETTSSDNVQMKEVLKLMYKQEN